jgi:L-arabinose isomerase
MRYVAVTEGDKVSAEACFGYSVNHYAVGDLVAQVNAVSDAEVTKLCAEYEERYLVAAPLRKNGARHESLRDGARIELGARLPYGGLQRFTTNFQDLHGLAPGRRCSLVADGYGFASGDWKTAALVRAMKVITPISRVKLPSWKIILTTFPQRAPGARLHMLEVCESRLAAKPKLGPIPRHRGWKTRCVWSSTRRRGARSMSPLSISATASG